MDYIVFRETIMYQIKDWFYNQKENDEFTKKYVEIVNQYNELYEENLRDSCDITISYINAKNKGDRKKMLAYEALLIDALNINLEIVTQLIDMYVTNMHKQYKSKCLNNFN